MNALSIRKSNLLAELARSWALPAIQFLLCKCIAPMAVVAALTSVPALARAQGPYPSGVSSGTLCSTLSNETRVGGVTLTLQRLQEQALTGDVRAQACLGSWFAYWGSYRRSYGWFLVAAYGGNPFAEFNLGVLYDKGWGAKRDEKQAARWYGKAARQGLANAQFNLASLYEHGLGVAHDPKKAARWYRAAAEQGLGRAEYALGVLYHQGQGVARNDSMAVRWLRAAAERNVAAAQYDLAVLLETGRGVVHDEAQALYWYRNAAEQGMTAAQLSLAMKYLDGTGGSADPVSAVRWFRLAAEQGDPIAQYRLALLYAQGQGVAPDPVRADMWLRLAASSLSEARLARRAVDLRMRVESRMTAKQRDTAHTMAATWRAGQLLLENDRGAVRNRPKFHHSNPFGDSVRPALPADSFHARYRASVTQPFLAVVYPYWTGLGPTLIDKVAQQARG